MDSDEILRDVGEYGKYQKLMLWFVLLPAHLPFEAHYYSQLFMSLTPTHWCKDDEHSVGSWSDSNATYRSLTMWTRGLENPMNPTIALCGNRTSGGLSTTNWTGVRSTTCASGYNYDRTELYHEESIVTMWDLVCDLAWMPSMALSLFCAGAFIGQWLNIFMTNRCGRRMSFFVFLGFQCLFGVVTALAPDFLCFVALRVIVGMTASAVVSSPSALAQELVSPKYRQSVGFLSYVARSLGLVFLSIMVFLVRDWSHIALVTTLPFLAFFLYWWVFPESPGWLKDKGRYEEYGRLLEIIAQANGRALPPDYIINLKRRLRVEGAVREERRRNRNEAKYTFWDLFRTSNMRKKSTSTVFIWFTTTTACVGLNHYSLEMEGEIYFNFFIAAGAEVAAVVVVVVAAEWCGRRCSFCLSSALGGALTLTIATTQTGAMSKLTMFAVAKLSISFSSVVLPLWTNELLPLVVRSLGKNLVDVIGLLGPIALPLLWNEGRKSAGVPLLTLGSLQLAGAVVALLLPETIDQKDLQTLKDGEHFGKHWTWMDCFRIGHRKQETKNGILKNRGPQPQSPILSLLRRQDSLRRASSEGEPEHTEIPSETSSEQGSIEETVKITVV